MDATERIRQQTEQVGSLYPAERERVERAAATAFELDHPVVYRALERALRGVLEAREPGRARRQIDELERACALVSPDGALAGAPGPGARRVLRGAAVLLAGVAVVALAVGLVALVLE